MQKTSVLIVEDEALIAEEIRDHMERLGHTVAGIVDNAYDAVAAARDHRPGLVLMDIRIKGAVDGIEAAFMIQEMGDAPVVFLTAHSDQATVERAVLSRPFAYLVKPVRQEDLMTAVQTTLMRHKAEEGLRAADEQARALLDQSSDLIIRAFPDGRLLGVNARFREALGYSVAHAVRLKLRDVVHATDYDAFAEAVTEATSAKTEVRVAVTLLTKDGRGVPVEGKVGRRMIGDRIDGIWAVFHEVEAAVCGNGASRPAYRGTT
jgi:PAS domain S-box-containing protein